MYLIRIPYAQLRITKLANIALILESLYNLLTGMAGTITICLSGASYRVRTGLIPTWKDGAIPTRRRTQIWSVRKDLNLRHLPSKGSSLPTGLRTVCSLNSTWGEHWDLNPVSFGHSEEFNLT